MRDSHYSNPRQPGEVDWKGNRVRESSERTMAATGALLRCSFTNVFKGDHLLVPRSALIATGSKSQ
jgi:hypothetical protein